MRKLSVFEQISLDGYFTDEHDSIDWTKDAPEDQEYDAFTQANAEHDCVMVFGRITYDLMASYWTSAETQRRMPELARRMNRLPKIVFSRSLQRAAWGPVTLFNGELARELRRLKEISDPDLLVLGSGQLVAQLAPLPALVDEYQFVVVPTVLGRGRTPFAGLDHRLHLALRLTRGFRNGRVYQRYTTVS